MLIIGIIDIILGLFNLGLFIYECIDINRTILPWWTVFYDSTADFNLGIGIALILIGIINLL